jgi:peptide subunit release factor 1 (eRF1)
VTKHGDYLKIDLIGGYDWYDAVEYSGLMAPLLQKRRGEKIIDLLEYYSRRAGEGFVEYGMAQVWNAVREGKVETLLLENDYETSGFIRKGKNGHFETGERPFSDHDYFPLAVNELAQLAALHGAKVFFLDKGLMPAGSHAVAVCRY